MQVSLIFVSDAFRRLRQQQVGLMHADCTLFDSCHGFHFPHNSDFHDSFKQHDFAGSKSSAFGVDSACSLFYYSALIVSVRKL